MGDTSAQYVSIADLSLLRLQWPVPVASSMSWLQPELEQLRHRCKKCYRTFDCSHCGKWIKLDIARHVANYHLELSQQDCMDHLRLSHTVPASVRTSNMGKWFPIWTVTRQMWQDSLIHSFREYLRMSCFSVSVATRWSTTTVCSRRGSPTSHCEGHILTDVRHAFWGYGPVMT